MTDRAVRQLARELASLRTQVRALSLTPQLAFSSIEGGAVNSYDPDGTLGASVGELPDGTQGVIVVNQKPPPAPSKPRLSTLPHGIVIRWDGANEDGSEDQPLDWSRLEIHISTEEDFDPLPSTLKATVETPQGGTFTFIAGEEYDDAAEGLFYVRFLARNTSGKASDPGPVESSLLGASAVPLDVADFSLEVTKLKSLQHQFVTRPTLTANSPTPGSVAWTGFTLVYNGGSFNVAAGNSPSKYLIWLAAAPNVLTGRDTTAGLAADDLVVIVNHAGVGIGVQSANVVDGSLIVNETIVGDAIVANTISGLKLMVDAITAREIKANSITADHLKVNALDGKIMTGGVVRTSATVGDGSVNSQGVQIDVGGLRAYRVSASTPVTVIDSNTGKITSADIELSGSATVSGTLMTSNASGAAIWLGASASGGDQVRWIVPTSPTAFGSGPTSGRSPAAYIRLSQSVDTTSANGRSNGNQNQFSLVSRDVGGNGAAAVIDLWSGSPGGAASQINVTANNIALNGNVTVNGVALGGGASDYLGESVSTLSATVVANTTVSTLSVSTPASTSRIKVTGIVSISSPAGVGATITLSGMSGARSRTINHGSINGDIIVIAWDTSPSGQRTYTMSVASTTATGVTYYAAHLMAEVC